MTNVEIAEMRSQTQLRPSSLGVVCEGLMFKIFSQPTDGRGLAIAFTSAHAGAGVTEITRTLAKNLRRGEEQLAVALTCQALIQEGLNFDSSASADSSENLHDLQPLAPHGKEKHWDSIQTILETSLERFRSRHRIVLIDCAPVTEAQDVVRLAPLVDGIVLIAEANKTKQEQIRYAEKTIEAAKGQILGYVLNKRTYAIPNWFHNMMVAVGI